MRKDKFLIEMGKRIRKKRIEKNMSQIELASACEFEKASMSRIESGQINTTVLTLLKISNALGVHISELFIDQK
ncbi:MAG: helix-turn-helix transcriptional regulator [Bacteroidetes bacterium]|nr:helix-turn-helix transcriptional regulator [Bacteroidota bacterium]